VDRASFKPGVKKSDDGNDKEEDDELAFAERTK